MAFEKIMKKYVITIMLSFFLFSSFAQDDWNFGRIPDLKICVIIPENSNKATALHSSKRIEYIDISEKLCEEINAYLELDFWVTGKAYLNDVGAVTVYGRPEYVKSFCEKYKRSLIFSNEESVNFRVAEKVVSQ